MANLEVEAMPNKVKVEVEINQPETNLEIMKLTTQFKIRETAEVLRRELGKILVGMEWVQPSSNK